MLSHSITMSLALFCCSRVNGLFYKKPVWSCFEKASLEIWHSAESVKNIMQTVTTPGGTGVNAALERYSVCGKTGTARKLDESGKYSNSQHVASFVGFTPAKNPAIAVLVVIDEPKDDYYAGVVAAPVFKEIAEQTLNYLNIPPDDDMRSLRVSWDRRANG